MEPTNEVLQPAYEGTPPVNWAMGLSRSASCKNLNFHTCDLHTPVERARASVASTVTLTQAFKVAYGIPIRYGTVPNVWWGMDVPSQIWLLINDFQS